jgi:molybdate transport system substrate-binding protein
MSTSPSSHTRGARARSATPAAALAATLAALLALAGCGGASSGDSGGSGTTITVYAAASLTSSFQKIADTFQQDHPGTTVRLSFGGSSDLVSQIQNGAPADVFASADTANMDKLTADHLTDGAPRPFATNHLEIAVPPGDPAGVHTFADLAKPGLRLVVCAPEVPCGAAAQQVARKAGVTLKPVSEEQSVTDVLAKVTSGEADAGLVYVTDVKAAGKKVDGIPFRESSSVTNTYPIAVVQDSPQAALAREFVAAVTGAGGRRVLRAAGFGTP